MNNNLKIRTLSLAQNLFLLTMSDTSMQQAKTNTISLVYAIGEFVNRSKSGINRGRTDFSKNAYCI